uniref:Uncharacterized protein n=1 Tax=Paramoeba aestuarina TaxID=180227 RepID=A0A7S4NQ79_9EUKA|mmetsp:Transcript_23074/g.35932  ORF Transcript_23074/g.35932 Transcript_23074/m.35932 type:complete len:103 (+) Transcript_23074:315-623(+)
MAGEIPSMGEHSNPGAPTQRVQVWLFGLLLDVTGLFSFGSFLEELSLPSLEVREDRRDEEEEEEKKEEAPKEEKKDPLAALKARRKTTGQSGAPAGGVLRLG